MADKGKTGDQIEVPGTKRTHLADVEEAADELVEQTAKVKEERETLKHRHDRLRGLMKKHGLEVWRLSDDRVIRVKPGEDKVKVEKPKRARGRRRGGFGA